MPANLNALTTDVPPARLPGTASTASTLMPAHISAEPSPIANHSAPSASAEGAKPERATSTEQIAMPMKHDRHAAEAVDGVARRTAEQHPGDAEAGQQDAAQDRAEPELVRGLDGDEEPDAGDARVAGERRAAEQPDAAGERRRAAARASSRRSRVVRREEREAERDDHLAQERVAASRSHRAAPPPSGASAIAAVCTAANVPTARPIWRGGTTSARPASSSGVRNAFAVPCSARMTMNVAEVRREGRGEREQRVGDVARCAPPSGARSARRSCRTPAGGRRTGPGRRGASPRRRRSWRRTRRAAAGRARPRPRRRTGPRKPPM